VQITQRLRAATTVGVFGPGSVLPSETQLNQLFGVSRATSRAALNELEREGLIVRRAGKGSIVLRQKVNQPAEEMGGFSEDMIRRGLKPSYRTLEAGKTAVGIQVAEALEIRSETRAFRSRRLLLADGEPMGLAISWIPPRLLRGIAPPTCEELTHGSLYEWMFRHCGTRLVRAREFIEAAEAEAEMAALLEVRAGAPLLIARRQSFDESGKPAEYSVLHFRSDRYRFQLEVTRNADDVAGTLHQGRKGPATPHD
jgi:GntR family transcriptional regulator